MTSRFTLCEVQFWQVRRSGIYILQYSRYHSVVSKMPNEDDHTYFARHLRIASTLRLLDPHHLPLSSTVDVATVGLRRYHARPIRRLAQLVECSAAFQEH